MPLRPIPDIPLLRTPFYFLRHGESTANRANVIAGGIDAPLTERGIAQAEAAAALMTGIPLGSVYASTLSRAIATALPFARPRGLTVGTLAGLGERNWGILENRPLDERIGGPEAEVPGAEPWNTFVARTWRALGEIDGPRPVLIAAHSGTLRALRQGLGIDDGAKGVNAEPLIFRPPAGPGMEWTYEKVTRR
jgi:probable phosphoglycerate mutase